VAWRYDFYLLVLETIFYSLIALVRKILFSPLEDKSHIFAPPCNILYISTFMSGNWENEKLSYNLILSCARINYELAQISKRVDESFRYAHEKIQPSLINSHATVLLVWRNKKSRSARMHLQNLRASKISCSSVYTGCIKINAIHLLCLITFEILFLVKRI
jgi:hypothetical protein